MSNMTYLFEPKSVAVIGASHDPSKVGYKLTENIVTGGYTGKVFPVNPKGGSILRLPVYASVEEVDDTVDMAVICVPSPLVFQAVETCARKKVKILPIITSGFSEVGNTEEERRIVTYARDHGMRILGPNIFGIYSAATSLNATFGPRDIMKGKVAILTQSGALGASMIGKTAVERIGLSAIVSVGNKSDVSEPDLLEYLVGAGSTKVILMYIEGVKDGEKLVKTLKDAAKKKPLVVIKSGRSKRGAMAAASHTGSLAGQDDVFDAIMRQCGVLRAESVKEAFNWCKFLADSPLPPGENTVIVTNGGGLGVMATDACEKYGVNLYDDTTVLKKVFGKVTPSFGSTKNPVDLTGQAGPQHYESALKGALKAGSVDCVLGLYCETALFDLDALSRVIAEKCTQYRKAGKPIVFSLLGGEKLEGVIRSLKDGGMPVFSDVYECVSCLGALYSYYHHIREAPERREEFPIAYGEVEAVVSRVREEGRYFLLSHEAEAVMKAAGIPTPRRFTARTLDEALSRAEEIGYPVVLKVVSRDIIHKSDAGGVALHLENEKEVIDAYEAIMYNCRAHNPKAVIEGVEVAEMVTSGIETIVGARRDQSFGPVVMVGMGGIYVEVFKDVSFRAYPLDRKEVLTMMKETRSYPLLLGVRGEEKKDVEGVVEAVLKVGALIHTCKGISDIEINPLVVYESGKGVKAVDVRILLSKEVVP